MEHTKIEKVCVQCRKVYLMEGDGMGTCFSCYMKDIPFPECSKHCGPCSYLGVGECDSICPGKFTEVKHEDAKNRD